MIGAEPYIAVNSGFGDDHSAAEEVEYVNGPPTSRRGRLRAARGHLASYVGFRSNSLESNAKMLRSANRAFVYKPLGRSRNYLGIGVAKTLK